MTQDNLLNQDDQPQIDESKDYYEEYVGEGKKFKDNQALAKGKAYSDAHIALLERRFDELSEDYKKKMQEDGAGAKLQELLDKLEAQQAALASREQNPNSNEEQAQTMDLTKIDSLLDSKVQQYEQTRKERENYSLVESKAKEVLGTNYKTLLKNQATSLGLTDEDVTQMAKKNPNLFIKTFDLSKPQGQDFQSPPKGMNTGFAPAGKEVRKWSYYQEMKKKDPKAWLDKKIAIQMEKDAHALGADFYDV